MAKEFVGQEYSVATNGKGLAQDSRGHRVLTKVTITFSVTVMLISIAMIAVCAVFILSPITGTSMMRQLNATGQDTDSALTYRLGTAQRGDIIITKLYLDETGDDATNEYNLNTKYPYLDGERHYMQIIKRLIAVGGDQITMQREPKVARPIQDTDYNYYIYLNNERLVEDYLDPEVGHPSSRNFIKLWHVLHSPEGYLKDWCATNYADCVKDGVLTIPEGYWFFMGDNRGGNVEAYGNSWDCTAFGPQSASYCTGVCVDVVSGDRNLPAYLWDKIVYYVFFGWAWQK